MNELNFLKPISVLNKKRIGPNRDGGYVVYLPVLEETDVLISYGVGWDVSFEEHFNTLTGKSVYMFDHTMFGKYLLNFTALKGFLLSFQFKSASKYLQWTWKVWRKKKVLEKTKVYFINEGICVENDFKCKTFDQHIDRFNLTDKKILLKIDIEGSEFAIFNDKNIYQHLENVNQMIIEFHNLKSRLREIFHIIQQLKKVGFEIIHIHGNNFGCSFVLYDFIKNMDMILPDVFELTFVKRKLICLNDICNEPASYPTPNLDYPNNPMKKEEFVWNFSQSM